MLTVTKLAQRCGVSRTTLLYYESIRLIPPPQRNGSNYRYYDEADVQRLLSIRSYRDAGLTINDIRAILSTNSTNTGGKASGVLKRRLLEIDAEIATLRSHQRAILKLLQSKALGKAKMISKEKWVSIMKACGLTDEQMHRWHAEFEHSAPAEHQEFLEFLHIPADEIATIRKQSSNQR
jgi:DNA-binding transcriptional MerR regulator